MSTIPLRFQPRRDLPGLAVSLLLCFSVAGLGGYGTSLGLGPWYDSLSKPSWTPPNWLFGPVWTLLYLAMAVSAWLVWRRNGFSGARLPLTLFGVQLALNLLWSVLFFAMRQPGLAALEILLLWVSILATLLTFSRISPLAAALLVPYLAWVSFASALNIAIWRLNS